MDRLSIRNSFEVQEDANDNESPHFQMSETLLGHVVRRTHLDSALRSPERRASRTAIPEIAIHHRGNAQPVPFS